MIKNTILFLRHLKYIFSLLIIFSLVCGSTPIAIAAGSPIMEKIEIVEEDGFTRIIIHFDRKVSYTISELSDPPRLLLDFKTDVETKLPERQIIKKGNIDLIRAYYLAKTYGEKDILLPVDALVIEYSEMLNYKAVSRGNTIVITSEYAIEYKDTEEAKQLQQDILTKAQKPAEVNKEDINKYIREGKAYYRDKQYEEAIKAWENALSLAPTDQKILSYLRRARSKITKTELEESPIEEKKEVDLKTISDQIDNYLTKGRKLYRQDLFKEAVTSWQMVLKLDPNNSKAKRYIEKAKEKLTEKQTKIITRLNPVDQTSDLEKLTEVKMPSELPDILSEGFEEQRTNYKGLSLSDCFKIGLKNNHSLKISQEEVVLAHLKSEDARKLLLPKGSLKWSETLGTVSGNEYRGRALTFEVQQSLYDGDKAANTYRQAKVNIVVSLKNYEKEKMDFLFEIEEDYYVLANAKKHLNNLQQALEKCKKTMAIVKQKVEMDLSKPIDLLNVKTTYNDTFMKIASAKNDLELAKLSLKQKLVIPPNAEIDVQPTPGIKSILDIDFEETLNVAYENRPDLLVNELMVLYHMYSVKMAKGAEHYKVDLNSSIGLNDEAYTSDPLRLKREWYVGVKLSRPLGVNELENNMIAQDKVPQAGQTTSSKYTNNTVQLKFFQNKTKTDIAEKVVAYHKAIQDYYKSKNSVFYEIQEGIFKYKKAILKIDNTRSSMSLTKKEITINKVKAELDEAQLSDLLKMEVKLHDQITDYEQAVTDYYTQIAKLNKLMGVPRYYDALTGNKNIKWGDKRKLPSPDIAEKRWWQFWKQTEDDEITSVVDKFYDLDEEFDKFYPMDEEKRPNYKWWKFWTKDKKWEKNIYPVKQLQEEDFQEEEKHYFWQFWKSTESREARELAREIENKKNQASFATGEENETMPIPVDDRRKKEIKKEKAEYTNFYIEQIKSHRLLGEERQLLEEKEFEQSNRSGISKLFGAIFTEKENTEDFVDISDFYPIEADGRILIPEDKTHTKKWWKFWQSDEELNLYSPQETEMRVILPEEDHTNYRMKEETEQLMRYINNNKTPLISAIDVRERGEQLRIYLHTTQKIFFKPTELTTPPRLLISFETPVKLGVKDNYIINKGDIKGIRFTRIEKGGLAAAVIIDMSYPVAYNIVADDNNLIIILDNKSDIL